RCESGYVCKQMIKPARAIPDGSDAAVASASRQRSLPHRRRGNRAVTHLPQRGDMSLPAVSEQLRVLEKAGLLRRRRYGRVNEMELDAKPLKKAAQWVEEYRKFWEGSLDRLADYLEKTAKKGAK